VPPGLRKKFFEKFQKFLDHSKFFDSLLWTQSLDLLTPRDDFIHENPLKSCGQLEKRFSKFQDWETSIIEFSPLDCQSNSDSAPLKSRFSLFPDCEINERKNLLARIEGIEIMSMFPLAGFVVVTSFFFEDKDPRALMTGPGEDLPAARKVKDLSVSHWGLSTSRTPRNRGRRNLLPLIRFPMTKQKTDKKENRLEFCPPLSSLRFIPVEEIQTEFKRKLRNKRGYLDFE
jgi:hypothetical protein